MHDGKVTKQAQRKMKVTGNVRGKHSSVFLLGLVSLCPLMWVTETGNDGPSAHTWPFPPSQYPTFQPTQGSRRWSPGAVRPNFVVVVHSVASDFPLENPPPSSPNPGSQGGHVSQAWPNTVPVSGPLSGGQRSLGCNQQQGVCPSSRATHSAGDPTAAGHPPPCGRAWRVKQTGGSTSQDSTQSPPCLKPPAQARQRVGCVSQSSPFRCF